MLVPILRFKDFTESWQEKILKDIATCFQYGMNLPSKSYDGYNKYIRITDIDEKTRNYISNFSVSPDGKLQDKFIVNKNDILFSRTGASVGKTYLYKEKDGRLFFAGFLIRVHIDEKYNSYFVFSQTLISRYFKWVKLISMRTGQSGINLQEYAQYKVYIPSLNEQIKIADFLSLIDKKIELQQVLLDNLRLYKKGLLKKVFSNSRWQSKRLGEFFKVQNGFAFNKENINNNGIAIIKINNIQDNTIVMKNLSYSNNIIDDKFRVYHGNLLIAMSGATTGKIGIYKFEDFSYFNQRVGKFVKISNSVIYEYLYCICESSIFQNALNSMLTSSAQPNISSIDIENIKIPIPSIEEQEYISNLFISLNKKIDFESEILERFRIYKRGLLQKMFI